MGSASRTKRRSRIDRLQEAVERICDGDRKFFARHPDRNHRLRLAGQAEIEMMGHVHGGRLFTQPGMRIYAVVRQLAPGARMRNFVANEPGLDTDISEFEASWLFDFLAPPGSKAAQAEASLRSVLGRWRAAN